MRQVDQWFTNLVERRTGWPAGRVFRINGTSGPSEKGEGDVLRLSVAQENLALHLMSLRKLLHRNVVNEFGEIGFDLPNLAAWSLGRLGEGGRNARASKTKEPSAAFHAHKQGVGRRPFVDILIERFCDRVVRLRDQAGFQTPSVRRPWPNGKKAAVCFTHDVGQSDTLANLSGRRLFSRDVREEADHPASALRSWLALESEYEISSTYFFSSTGFVDLAKGAGETGTKALVDLFARRGAEIGVLAPMKVAGSSRKLARHRNRLIKAGVNRLNAMRHATWHVNYPDSWWSAGEAGFAVVCDMGWSGQKDGFRAGTCWPWRPAAVPGVGGRAAVIEVPYCMRRPPWAGPGESFSDVVFRLLEEVRKVGGVFVLDLSFEGLDERQTKQMRDAARRIYQAVASDSDLWIAPVSQVVCSLYEVQSPT